MTGETRRLEEYDIAWQSLVGVAAEAMLASHPLLGQIARRKTPHAGPIRNVRIPTQLDQPPGKVESVATIGRDDLRLANIEAHSNFLAELALEHVKGMAKFFFATIDEVTEAAGTSHSSGGQPLSWDLFLDMVERMQISFDAEGKADLPTLIGHPDTIASLQPMTPEQEARLEEILRKKQEEHAATKRSRRLPR
jgi:hypothetical protein